MKRPTQVDVARKAGVSRATVSYVLNDQVDLRVPISPKTRQRVLDVIAELGYEPDARAQSLRNGSTKTIGVLLPIYENPYFWQILSGIAGEAETSGYSLLLSHNSLTAEQEQRSLRELAQRRVDGLILMINFKFLPVSTYERLRRLNRPVVEITSTDSVFDYLQDGYQEGTQALMEHLFQLGHRRIGFVYGVVDEVQGIDRLEPYRQALSRVGVTVDESLFLQCGQTMEDGYQAAVRLLSQPNRPTALLVINDLLGMAALRAAADLGLRVPQDVSIASFDNIPFGTYTVPRLTTVAHEPERTGRLAFQLLLRRMSEPESPHQTLTVGWQLLVRESTAPVSTVP